MELGLTAREVAAASGCTTTVVRRLEKDGEPGDLSFRVVTSLLDNLALDLWQVRLVESPPEQAQEHARRLGGLLHSHGKGLPLTVAAECLQITTREVEHALVALNSTLRESGLCVHEGSTGLRIVPTEVRSVAQACSSTERLRSHSVLNRADLSLLRRIAVSDARKQNVSATNNGNVSLLKLENAGLIQDVDGKLEVTPSAQQTLGLE